MLLHKNKTEIFGCGKTDPSQKALTLQERLAFRIGSVQVDSSQKKEVGDQTKKKIRLFFRTPSNSWIFIEQTFQCPPQC